MRRFKVFTNDRGKENGVPMFSCFVEIHANSPADALKRVHWIPKNPGASDAVAIAWPAESDSDKAWIRRHVG